MTVPFTLPGRGRAEIRSLEPGDLPAVTRLFQRNFRDPRRAPPLSLQTYLHKLFLEHPGRDPGLMSRVIQSNEGTVNGFLGVLPLKMDFRGRTLQAAAASGLMVDEPEKNPLAGAKLLRSFIAGPQDLSLSESANPLAQGMWSALGGHVAPLCSLEWLRVLRPGATGVSLLADSVPAANLLRPFAALTDGVLKRMKGDPFRFAPLKHVPDIRDVEADENGFIEQALRFASGFALRPDWDAGLLRFVLNHAARKERHGALFRRLVYAGGTQPIGGYIYYGRPGGVAWVLQIFHQPGKAGPILDSLTAHARDGGAVALRGRTHPMLMDALMLRGCVFVHRSSTVVHARDPALVAAALSGEALITGMAGESWTRLIGGMFQ